MRFHPSLRLVWLLLPASLLFQSGCATASKSESMTVATTELARHHAGSVRVNVTGGSETSAAGASKISNQSFATALEDSIKNTALFQSLAATGAGDYHLEVLIARLEQPMFGFSMTVTLETNWTLSRLSDKKILWQKAIPTSYTAKAGDAFAGVTRLRLANEGAARTNIQAALTELSALDLP